MTTNTDVKSAVNKEGGRPTNTAAERVVLAGLCQFGGKIYTDCNEILNIECFTHDINPFLFKTLQSILIESNLADIPSLVAKGNSLGFNFSSDRNQMDYIKRLFTFGVKEDNVIQNAKLLRKLDIARKAQVKCRDIFKSLSSVTGEETFSEILNKIEQPIFDFTTSLSVDSGDKTQLVGDGIEDFVNYLKDNPGASSGIPSIFSIYDKAIGRGRRRGGVYLIGARPKVGKSSIAINDAIHLAKQGIPVLYLDTEMSIEGQWPRILANVSGVTIEEIETAKFASNDYKNNLIAEATNLVKSMPLSYRRIAGKPFGEILSIIRNWVLKDVGTTDGRTNNCIVIYDYFKMMDTSVLEHLQEYQAMGFQIQQLADFCGKYDIPCSAFVQINRDGIDKDTSDILSQSDRLLWLCSSVAFLKRKTSEEIQQDGRENGNMKLIVTPEQRYGPGLDDGDWINLKFDKDKCQLTEIGTRFTMQKSDSFETESVDTDGETEDETDGEAEF